MPFGTTRSGERAERGPGRPLWPCAGLLACSLLLGGGTHGGFLSDAVLEMIAIPVFLMALAPLLKARAEAKAGDPPFRRALMLCAAISAVPLIQLIPLPSWMWRNLPGRESVSVLLDLTGQGGIWMPLSTTPASTWLSALSLLPPLAIFLDAAQLGYRQRRVLSLIIVAIGILSAFLGLLQIAQGPSSPLRPFAFTNNLDAVGFFANRNHFAALLYVVLLFAAVWAIDGVSSFDVSWQHRTGAPSTRALALTAGFLVLVLLIAAQAMARSRTGLVLTAAALAGAFALAAGDRRDGRGMMSGRLITGATTVAVMLAVQFALYRIADRFIVDPSQDARIPIAHNTVEAATAFMPFGAGVGSFVPIYAMFESPQTAFVRMYANHAHNDFLEVWLETGGVGILLVGLFFLWIVRKSMKWWQRPPDAQSFDHTLARAGLVVIGLLMMHSFVDYPLRTEALEAVFAFACALLVPPPGGSGPHSDVRSDAEFERAGSRNAKSEGTKSERAKSDRSGIRETSPAARRSRSPQAVPAADSSGDSTRPMVERRSEDIDWREKWRRQSTQNPSGDA
jgi:O-antigen ligase